MISRIETKYYTHFFQKECCVANIIIYLDLYNFPKEFKEPSIRSKSYDLGDYWESENCRIITLQFKATNWSALNKLIKKADLYNKYTKEIKELQNLYNTTPINSVSHYKEQNK